MGRFVNSGNSAFQVALNSEIYVDKTGLLAWIPPRNSYVIVALADSENLLPPICSLHIIVKTATLKKCSHLWKSARHLISENI